MQFPPVPPTNLKQAVISALVWPRQLFMLDKAIWPVVTAFKSTKGKLLLVAINAGCAWVLYEQPNIGGYLTAGGIYSLGAMFLEKEISNKV